MTKVGTKLRKQRERLNRTLAEIAATTNIREHFLAAIERGDYSELPGGVFEKGFIRTYAESLGLDVSSVLEEYERERAPEDGPSDRAILERLAESHGTEPPWEARRLRQALFASVAGALVALGALAWVYLRGPDEARVEPPAPATVTPATVAPPTPVAPSLPPPAPPPAPLPAPPATSVPPPATAVEPPPAASRLRVPDYGVGTDVVDRKLVGRSDRFKEGTAVWFWTRVRGGRRGDVLQHVWIHDGRTIGVRDLDIGGSHWRTQSVVTLGAGSSGAWQVEARDGAGRVLARATFTCD